MSKYIIVAINREQLAAARHIVANWQQAVFGTMDDGPLAGLADFLDGEVPVYFYEPG